MTGPARPSATVAAVAVDEWRSRTDELRTWLDDDERRRVETLRDPDTRRRFVVAHALLRSIVGTRLGRRPGDVHIGTDRLGRPRPRDPGSLLRCSLSHAGGLVVAAVADGVDIGVDVEPIDARRADLPTVARFLPPADASALGALPPAARTRAIALAWTRLEAEAKGRGLALDDLRGKARTGLLEELDVGDAHVASVWTAAPSTIVRVDGLQPSRAR